jgi:hypothetical protein
MRAALAVVFASATLVAPTPASARQHWFVAADAHCASATVEGKRLVASIPTIRTQADALAFLRTGVRIHERLLTRLRAAGPPAGDAGVQRFMSVFSRSVELDRKSLAALERRMDQRRIQRWLVEGSALEESARRTALRIGLRGCARYLDPATYR